MHQNMNEVPQIIETEMLPKAFDAVVACGMGPLELRPTRPETHGANLVARNYFNILNGISAKLLAAHGLTDTVILSGYASQTAEVPATASVAEKALRHLERSTSEAQLLEQTYHRAHPKNVTPADRQRADRETRLDYPTTTFGNIIGAVNDQDRVSLMKTGHIWDGSLGVISSEFHGPRINEMMHMFGVKGQYVSAERVMKRFGYGNGPRGLYPENSGYTLPTGERKPWQQFETETYNGQPQNFENLKQNPRYVTKYLAEAEFPERFQQMAQSLKQYIEKNGTTGMPDVFHDLPDQFDPSFDYEGLKRRFAEVPSKKETYVEAMTTEAYRAHAHMIANETTNILRGQLAHL
jgi:hypothetical protein